MTTLERAKQWLTSPVFDAATRAEVAQCLQNPAELAQHFGHELHFGTGGLRGVLGVGTNRMNIYTVARASTGLAKHLLAHGGQSVAIAYDSRHGSQAFAQVTAGVMAAHGLRAYLFPRLMPTPVLSFAVRALGADAGVMVTASHNPAIYNGYKVYGRDGCQITEAAADAITAMIGQVAYASLHWLDMAQARAQDLVADVPPDVYQNYLRRTLDCRVYPQASAPVTLCYTPLHGTGLEPVRDTLRTMAGLRVVEVAQQLTPDGDFPTCPQPNPELLPTLALAIQTAGQAGAGLVIATDPDCDRIGVAVQNAAGGYTVLSGNEVGLLLMQSILAARKAQGTLPQGGEVVKTIVTSDLAFAIAADYGVAVHETLTGFKYIGEEIGRLEALGQQAHFLFGFEESCGYLAGTHVRDKDGVLAAMLVCELAQQLAAQGGTLLTALEALYARYGRMDTRLMSFDLAGSDPMAEMDRLMRTLRQNPPETLAGQPLTGILDYLPGLQGLPPADVLAFRCARGKAIVRPSGTEPKVKVYLFAPGSTAAETQATLAAMAADATRWLS